MKKKVKIQISKLGSPPRRRKVAFSPKGKKRLNYLLSREKGKKLPWGTIFFKEELCEYLTKKYKG
jgi:hypothetical protein